MSDQIAPAVSSGMERIAQIRYRRSIRIVPLSWPWSDLQQ